MTSFSSFTRQDERQAIELTDRTPDSHLFEQCWRGFRDQDVLMPFRQAIHPRKLGSLLPGISIWDTKVGPDSAISMEIKLAGTRFRTLTGRELTGERHHSSEPDKDPVHDELLRLSIRQPAGIWYLCAIDYDNQMSCLFSTTRLPIASEHPTRPDGVIVFTEFRIAPFLIGRSGRLRPGVLKYHWIDIGAGVPTS